MLFCARRRGSGGGRAVAAAAALAPCLAFCLGLCFALSLVAAGAFAEDTTVTIDNFTFKPGALTIKAGSQVTFVNHDDIPHSVVDSAGKFHSKVLDTDESFTMTFPTAGEVTYFCGLHPHMKGSIVVTP
jgi:plastocyanin